MRTPVESYNIDPEYKQFVDSIMSMLYLATFTPSEVREMATLACIHYEMRRTAPISIVVDDAPSSVERAIAATAEDLRTAGLGRFNGIA